ncbi:F-box/kelch-repeat protein [Spatholobus suberectus]|nr:F-box/kelch-repeat protein [Spatholobus suberectus]
MGSFFSVANSKSDHREWNGVSPNETCKRRRMSPTVDEESPRLIPKLPDELSLQIIARLPRICYFNVRLVSKKWKLTIMSSELYKVRKELGTTEEWLYLLIKVGENNLLWHALDPRSKIWQRVPNMPNFANEEESRKGSSRLWMWNMVEESPYLLAGFHGKLHVITKDANHNIAVLQAGPRNNLDSSPSPTTLSQSTLHESPELAAETDAAVVWRVVANRDFGQAELVSCQVIDI